ncbi:PAS domain S-box-containing protein/diguanylate cyclase (GGDEF) domain-containing protein [Marinospirillum celere]|uniref:cyclic-guanylate-specific phosphodiesterase n=1 Tax=Marinospirillum celere TaxID=1122252 RepID=A0A1I1I1H3_9GAMM|nr:GGDEF domain-containing phosphodiesterase [Marinospirillum celere]SFC30279.1 PAS domain S-box-containing protein/diguanylate cyclase (GGDEF) domain-containing protein [Marinospirillum celere]
MDTQQDLLQERLTSSYRDADLFYRISLLAASLALPLLWSTLPGGYWLPAWWAGMALLFAGGKTHFLLLQQRQNTHKQHLAWLRLGALLIGFWWALLLGWSLPLLPSKPLIISLALVLWASTLITATSIYAHFVSVSFLFALPGVVTLLAFSGFHQLLLPPLVMALPLLALAFNAWQTRKTLIQLQAGNQQILQLNQELENQHLYLEQEVMNRTQALQEEVSRHEKTSKELEHQRKRISQAIEASRLGLWDWDLDTDSIYHSHFEEIFGYADDEIPHFMGHLKPLVHPDDYPQMRRTLISALKGHSEHYQCRFRIRHKSGQWRWIEDHGEVVERHETTGKAQRMLGTRRDITEEQEKDDYLQLAWRAFEASGEATYIVDSDSQVIFVNQAFVDITGYSRQDVLEQSFWDHPCFAEYTRIYKGISRSLRHEGRWEGELTQKRRTGETYPQWLRVIRVTSGFKQDAYTIGIFSDLTHKKEVEARLTYLAEYDELTGLANRNQFYDRLHQRLAEARITGDELALLMFDIDRFKAYNNSLGHHAGDLLLKKVAERLTECLTDAEILARTGGNEFAVLLRANEQQALQQAEAFHEKLHLPFYIDQQELRLTLSAGLSCYPEHTHELQVLINQADQARLRAKATGGNRLQVYNEDIRQSSLEQLRLEQDLRRALDAGQIQVHFQPKLDLHTGLLSCAEALARWEHPEEGQIPPSVFIPLAERTGLIGQLGKLVLRIACQQAASWYQAGYNIQVAVNIAAQQVESGHLVEEVSQLLDELALPARLLQLELTESTLMEDAEAATLEMQNLRARGISLAIDDFGTGYSSLSYLQHFPLDILKIDRSFLMSENAQTTEGTLTRAIIALGHGLGMQVVAEGVEDEDQLVVLKELGCDYAQGFVISRPQPAELLEGLFAEQKKKL